MDKITDLPTAIRVGSLQHPQCFYGLFTVNQYRTDLASTCAIGAAGVAMGFLSITNFSYVEASVIERFDIDPDLLEYIETMNDDRRLSRETIAAILHAREWALYNHTESPLPL